MWWNDGQNAQNREAQMSTCIYCLKNKTNGKQLACPACRASEELRMQAVNAKQEAFKDMTTQERKVIRIFERRSIIG